MLGVAGSLYLESVTFETVLHVWRPLKGHLPQTYCLQAIDLT
jgi:hypothetical protein